MIKTYRVEKKHHGFVCSAILDSGLSMQKVVGTKSEVLIYMSDFNLVQDDLLYALDIITSDDGMPVAEFGHFGGLVMFKCPNVLN
jgi:hypothetical protein